MRSPDRKISIEGTHYEANLMQIRPKNMAKLKNTPKYVSNHDTSVNQCSQRTLMSKGQKRITKSSQIDTYLHKVRTRLIYPGKNIVKEKTTIKIENSIYICYTYNKVSTHRKQYPYQNSQTKEN